MRLATACLAASLLVLTACQDKTDPKATDTAAQANPDAPAQTGEAGVPADRENMEKSGMRPEMTPKIVTDTTPVDTQVLEVTSSSKADEKMLTGPLTDQFKPTDGVFLSIRTSGTADKYTLSAKWLTPTGETLTEYSQDITRSGEVNTIFSLSKPDGWAPGSYQVELSINGKLLKKVPFTVR